MRDLQADKEICEKAARDIWLQHEGHYFIAAARTGWPEAIERALRAEAQVAKIQGIVDNIKENLECSKYPCSFNSSLICTHKTCPYREVRNILVEAEQEDADD